MRKQDQTTFIIFHGSFGNPKENWFPELRDSLSSLGQQVLVPKFPVDDWDQVTATHPKTPPQHQTLKNWLQVFETSVMPKIEGNNNLCFVGHSLGPLFICHVVERFEIQLDSAIFVSPFLRKLGGPWQFDYINQSFYKTDFDFEKLRNLIPISYVLYSENDPYVDNQLSFEFAEKLGSSLIQVRKAGHMNAEVNLNEFPLVLELCKSRLDLSLYQRYLAHRRELYAVDYIKGRNEEEVIYLSPEEVFDEGVFKFRNLRRKGFCTFFTALSFWNTQSTYFQEARRAAQRVQDFTRVFVVDKIADLQRELLRQQVKLDLESGIKVYLVMWDEIKKLSCEPDFGIWDNDYLCVIKIGQGNQPTEIKLSSRKTDIQKGNRWAEKILHHATRINNIESNLKSFVKQHTPKK